MKAAINFNCLAASGLIEDIKLRRQSMSNLHIRSVVVKPKAAYLLSHTSQPVGISGAGSLELTGLFVFVTASANDF